MKHKRGLKGVPPLLLLSHLCSARVQAEMQQQHLSVSKNPNKIKYLHREAISFSEHEETEQKKQIKRILSSQMYSVEDLRPREAK